jgi:hypothetical protein
VGKIHLLHIGKTGGTAIRHALKQAPRNDRYELILHSHQTRLVDIEPSDRVIISVRDPISRFVSAFYSRQRKGRPRYFFEWSDLEQRLFDVFPTPDALALALADQHAPHHHLAVEGMEGLRHLRPQAHWLDGSALLLARRSSILHILFQETLAADFERLRGLLALPATIVLPGGDMEAHRNPAGLDRRVGSVGREALMAWYAQDFPLLDVCRQLWEERKRYADAVQSLQRSR